MFVLKCLNPITGYLKEFAYREEGPVLIGRMAPERALNEFEAVSKNVPEYFHGELREYLESARYSINMENCRLDKKYISRVHCIILPGEDSLAVDLFSKNGTVIAGPNGGMHINAGVKAKLGPEECIILAKGRTVFQFMYSENNRPLAIEREDESFLHNRFRRVRIPVPFHKGRRNSELPAVPGPDRDIQAQLDRNPLR